MIMISAIILAAGESRRMGRLKQLLPWGATTILGQVIENVRASKVDELILVVGYRAEEILAKVSHSGIKVKINPSYHEGLSSSIRVGLQAIDVASQAVLLVMGDQPLVSSDTMNKLIGTYQGHRWNKGIVVPIHRGRRGHPVIMDLKYKDDMMALDGDIGCRQILDNYPQDVLEIEVDTGAILQDIDIPEDFAHLLRN
jgi:molybdenum cofactor cytidylyltransferase